MAVTFGGPAGGTARRAIRAALLLALAAGSALPALAEEPEEVARRMDDRLFFVQSLDRGWEPLLADVAAAAGAVPEGARLPVLRVQDTVRERYAELRAAEGTEPGERRAFELFEALSREGVDEARRPEFARRCAAIEVAQATRLEKAGQDDQARALALSALRRSPGFEPAFDLLAQLTVKAAEKAEARDDFVAALAVLDESFALLPEGTSARGKVEERVRAIRASTGELTVSWLGSAAQFAQVRAPKTDFTAAKLELRPLEGQRPPPQQQVGGTMRVRNGRYDVVARGSGPAAFPVGQVQVASDGAALTLPVAMPENMVLVPAVGDQDAFLVDRTEVTAAEFQNPGSGAGRGLPATGVSFARAQDYARRAGKELPTLRQWLTAAFGDPSGRTPRYPWGEQPPQLGVHFVGGQDAPEPVGSRPAGASRATGCLDLAGNVWEWLADERFIGGGYRRSELSLEVQPKDESSGGGWIADHLRDPAPSDELWERMSNQDRDRYFNYRPRGNASTLEQIGLRCVIGLGKPRRQP